MKVKELLRPVAIADQELDVCLKVMVDGEWVIYDTTNLAKEINTRDFGRIFVIEAYID